MFAEPLELCPIAFAHRRVIVFQSPKTGAASHVQQTQAILAAAIALAVLAAMASGVQATNSFSISPGGNITSASLGKLSFASSAATIQCSLTGIGRDTARGLVVLSTQVPIGVINQVRINNASCSGGEVLEATATEETPWRGLSDKLVGERGELGDLIRLPIGKVGLLQGVNFKLGTFGGLVQCRYAGTSRGIGNTIRESTNEVNRRRLDFISELGRTDEAVRLRLVEGGGCPAEGFFAGTSGVTPRQKIIKLTP